MTWIELPEPLTVDEARTLPWWGQVLVKLDGSERYTYHSDFLEHNLDTNIYVKVHSLVTHRSPVYGELWQG